MYGNINHKRMDTHNNDTSTDIQMRVSLRIGSKEGDKERGCIQVNKGG